MSSCSAFLLSLGVKALAGQVQDDDKSGLHSATGLIGASVSGIFLWILGILEPGRAGSGSSRCGGGTRPYDEAQLEAAGFRIVFPIARAHEEVYRREQRHGDPV